MAMLSRLNLVCCSGLTILILVTSQVIDDNNEENIIRATDAEVIEYINSCPEIKPHIMDTCFEAEFSCRGKCDTITNIGNDIPKRDRLYCSCDDLCQVYQDCCWDFAQTCPHHWHIESKKWKPLIGAEIICKEGNAVISGCPDDTGQEPQHRFEDNGDLREPVVSEADAGLHFENRHVYSCYKQLLGLQDMTTWKKTFRHNNITMLSSDLQYFVQTGNASDAIKPHIHDYKPATVESRSCYGYSRSYCKGHDSMCFSFRLLAISNFTWVCQYVNQQITKPMNSMTCATRIFMDGDNDRVSDFPDFSIIMNINVNMEVDLTFQSRYEMEQLYCPEFLTKGSNANCSLGIRCGDGYVYSIVEAKCFKPNELLMLFEAESELRVLLVADLAMRELGREYNGTLSISLKQNVSYETESGGYGLKRTYKLSKFSMKHSGMLGLDIAKFLTSVLSSRMRNETRSLADDFTICLSMLTAQTCEEIVINDNSKSLVRTARDQVEGNRNSGCHGLVVFATSQCIILLSVAMIVWDTGI